VGLAVVNDLVASHDSEVILIRADRGGARVEVIPRAA